MLAANTHPPSIPTAITPTVKLTEKVVPVSTATLLPPPPPVPKIIPKNAFQSRPPPWIVDRLLLENRVEPVLPTTASARTPKPAFSLSINAPPSSRPQTNPIAHPSAQFIPPPPPFIELTPQTNPIARPSAQFIPPPPPFIANTSRTSFTPASYIQSPPTDRTPDPMRSSVLSKSVGVDILGTPYPGYLYHAPDSAAYVCGPA